MNAKERAMHLEAAPRTFADRPDAGDYAAKDAQRALERSILQQAEGLTVAGAVRVAQALLVHVVAVERFDYHEFQSANAVEKYVKRAVAALRGLGL